MNALGNLTGNPSITTARAESLAETLAADRSATMNPEQIRQAALQFEGMFTSLLLKEMRQTAGDGGLFSGESSDTLGGMFDMFLGEHLAQSGSLGVAQMIEAYLENAT